MLRCICSLVLALCSFSFLPAQINYNVFNPINQGIAKCADIGQISGVGDPDVDNFSIDELLDRRGEMYAYITYGNNGSNTAPCAAGLFRHDTVSNRWIKVAGPVPGSISEMMTNNTDIFVCSSYGNILKYNPDYAAFPNGWETLTPPGGLRGSDIPGAGCIQGLTWGIYGTGKFPQVVGDTIFFLVEAPCGNPNRIVKFNTINKSITVDVLGPFPHQGIPATNGATTGMGRFVVTKAMGGFFRYFISYPWFGSNNANRIPYYLWVFDPRPGQNGWRNISEGVNWMNITGSSNPPQTGWGPSGGFTASWDRREIYATSETGLYKWIGNGYEYLGANRENTTLLPTETGLFVRGRNWLELVNGGVASRIGDDPFWTNPCNIPTHNSLGTFLTPDNGKTLYAVRRTNRVGNCSGNGISFDGGIHRLRIDPTGIGTVRNIHLDAATYLGGMGHNEAASVGMGGKYQIFVGGNFPSVSSPTPFSQSNYHGATPASRGKILRLSASADSVLSVLNLGERVDKMEVQNFGTYRIAVGGSFGVSVFDSLAQNLLWHIPSAELPGTVGEKIMLDIDDQGSVAVLRSKRFRLYNAAGQALSAPTLLNKTFVNDITVKNDTVFVTGFQNDFLGGPPTGCGENGNLPVQVSFVFAYKKPANPSDALEVIFTTYNFKGSECGLDQADTRGYRINVGKDGKVYFLGEAAGGNSIFRWNGKTNIELNGCTNPPSTLVQFDNFNSPFNTSSAHIAYFCTINPKNGVVERGQYIIPRLSNGRSNSYRVRDAYIHADEDGFVYVGGLSTSAFAGRNVQKVNGQPIGTYAGGDMCVLVVTPNYKSRTFWGTFSKDTATGETVGIGIRGKRIAAIGNAFKGVNYTKNAMISAPFGPSPATQTGDVYLAVWGQELWKTANNDSIINTITIGNPVISTDSLQIGARFTANKTSVCVDSAIVFLDQSKGATSWVWDFGQGASLSAGTIGKGPHTVSYQTPGLKTVRLTINNGLSVEEKFNYINVLPGNLTLGQVFGPASLCNNAVATFSVQIPPQQSWGIESYVWTLPPGATILSGAGSSTIRVKFGSSSGAVSVQAKYGCGLSPAAVRNVEVGQGVNPFEAFFVVNSLFLTPGEQQIRNYLQQRGFAVQTVEDNNYDLNEGLCKGLIIISSTVDTALILNEFAALPGALVVLHPLVAQKLGLSTAFGITAAAENIVISNPTHPLAAGFTAGSVGVFTSPQNVGWGTPGTGAINVAHLENNPQQVAIFAYYAGQALPGGAVAAGKRLVFFTVGNGINALNDNGTLLLEKAICWSGDFCDLPLLTTNTLEAYFYCQSAALVVPFTAGGTFNVGNQFTLQLSDRFGNFASAINLGTIAGVSSGTFTVNLPPGFLTGNQYAVRVVASSPAVVGTPQSNISISNAFENEVVFLGDASIANGLDAQVISRLQNFHRYQVRYFSIRNVRESDLKCRKAVYISNTARVDQAAETWALLRNLDVPILLCQHQAQQGMGMTSNNNVYPLENRNNVIIPNNTHPITLGLPTGSVNVYPFTASADMTVGSLIRSSGQIIAQGPTNPASGAIYIYPKDSLLWNNRPAPELRMGFFLNYRRGASTFNTLTPEGLRLFDQSVCYTGQQGCQTITTQAIAETALCVGATIKIPFQVSGVYPFSGTNAFRAELSSPGGTFNFPTVIGSKFTSLAQDTIIATIPGTISSGTGYRVRVTATDGRVFVNDNGVNISISTSEAPLVTITGSSTTICQGESITLSGPQGASGYVWSNGATTPSITVSNSGTFTLQTGTAGGCLSTASTPVNITVLPLPAPIQISAQGSTAICQGAGSVTLVAPSGFQSYLWSTGATTPSTSVNTAGAYTVQVSTNGICFSPASNTINVTTSSNIPQPSITLVGDDYFCQGETAQIVGPPGFAGYQWSNGDTTQNIIVTQSGTYTLVVRNAAGCQSNPSSAITVTVVPRPPAPIITPSGTITLCSGNVTLSASSTVPGSIIWTNGINGTNLVVSLPGVYRAVLLSAEGCFGDTSAAVTVVQGTVPPTPTISASGALTLCAGESLTLSGPAGSFNYLWSNGSTASAITVNSAGSFYLTISSSDDCASTSDTLTVSLVDNPVINSVLQVGDSLVASTTGASQFTWLLNGVVLPFSGAGIPNQGEGLYQLVVRNTANCSSDTFALNLVSTRPVAATPVIRVFPVPFQYTIHVEASDNGKATLELFDAVGKRVQAEVLVDLNGYIITPGNVPRGVYSLVYTLDSERQVFRVVK